MSILYTTITISGNAVAKDFLFTYRAIYITLMICAYIAFLIRYRRKKQERNVWKTAHPRLRILTTDEGHAAAAQEAEDLRYKYETRQTKWYTDLRLIPRVGWWKH